MRTLAEIINTEANTDVEKAIQAAYWAGQSDMRASVTDAAGAALKTYKFGRYHLREKAAMAHLLAGCGQINTRSTAFGGTGDTGAEERDEIMSWDFDI